MSEGEGSPLTKRMTPIPATKHPLSFPRTWESRRGYLQCPLPAMGEGWGEGDVTPSLYLPPARGGRMGGFPLPRE